MAKRYYWGILWTWVFLFSYGIQAQSVAERKSIEDQINKAGKFFNQGDYARALDLSQKALKRSYKINDDYLLAHAYNAIGVIYDEFSEAKYALSFYNKALIHALKIENDSLKDWIYSNLGSVYYYNKIDVRKGIDYYKKALIYAQKIDDSTQITFGKLNIASAYFAIDDFEQGIRYLKESESFVRRRGLPEMRFTYASLSGIFLTHRNQPEQALKYYNQAVHIADQNKLESFLVNAYENIADHYKIYGQSAMAERYRKQSEALSNELYSQEEKALLTQSATQIQMDEYRLQLERIELENEKQLQKLKESRVISWLSLILCLVMLVLMLTLYRSNSFKRKAHNALLHTNEELRMAKEKAEEASQLKTQFVSTITHELRTPLYGVVGITDMLAEEHPQLKDSRHLNSLKFSARYLLSLVNDILQLNKIEEKKITLEQVPFVLADELEIIRNSVQYIAQDHHNTLEICIDAQIPQRLLGDKLRLSQIIMNLTSNALKFTRDGWVKVSAQLKEVQGTQYVVQFCVQDNGVGISPNDQNKIFDMFVQVGRGDQDYQGTGLGLAIVKKLVTLFGGQIHLESELGKGTSFTFCIGFEKAPEITQEQVFEQVFPELTALKILIVEDNKINQLVTQKIMDKHQIQCDMVADGFDALKILETRTYDAILMDINMPGMNGYQTTERLRAMGIKTPVIALTAFDKEEIKAEVFASGMNDIMIKPFEPHQLFEVIQRQMQKKD